MPVIGIRFTVIPTFSKTWVKNSPRMPNGDEAAEGVGGPPRDAEQRQEQREEQAQGHEDTHEPQLLTDDGEDEVGVLLRQEGEPLLGALGIPGPEPAARADGDPSTGWRGTRRPAGRPRGSGR